MAGDWIKVRTNLWDDPRVSQVCDLTDTGEAAVIGAMYWLWATADEHTEDGFLPGISLSAIDRKTGVKGIANALVTIGWLSTNDEGVTIERFSEHNGTSAKSRAQTARRVANHKGNAKVTPEPLPNQDLSVSDALPREEKRREELKDSPIPPEGAKPAEKKATAISFVEYVRRCKAESQHPIPSDDSVFDYIEKVGIPETFLKLQWTEFKDRYSEPGAKRYKAWPTVFRKSVVGNWFKLWYIAPDGKYVLTTVGVQAARNHEGKE